MNYRHAFHAGNFADLLKHAVLTGVLARLTADPSPLTVIDTHAGAGLYDLGGELARKTGEAARGIAVLMADGGAPEGFTALKRAVRRANGGGAVRLYPGSPVLIAQALRPRDRYVACELRPDDYEALRTSLSRNPGAVALKSDGWRAAAERTPAPPARAVVLIDPPFERGDDYGQAARAARAVLRANRRATVAIWLPIKDLATYDAALSDLEDAIGGATMVVAEVRLRPLSDPMKMNGCAVAVVNPPPGLAAPVREVADWIVRSLGETGAAASVT